MVLDNSLVHYGARLEQARTAVVLVHGRGGTAQGMLALANELLSGYTGGPPAFLAPQAPGNSWYPYPFLAPIRQNEPYLSHALEQLDHLLLQLENTGLLRNRVMLVGFSQGACLAAEYVARSARLYGGLAVLSGGLIGPPGTPRDYPGNLDGTPVFLGCSDVDQHIPQSRVTETAEVLERMGGAVTTRFYSGMGHGVNRDELNIVREMLEGLT